MKFVLSGIVFALTVIGVLYIGLWWGIVQPIMNIGEAIDNDAVTAGFVAWEVCKFFLREVIAGFVGFFGFTFAGLILTYND